MPDGTLAPKTAILTAASSTLAGDALPARFTSPIDRACRRRLWPYRDLHDAVGRCPKSSYERPEAAHRLPHVVCAPSIVNSDKSEFSVNDLGSREKMPRMFATLEPNPRMATPRRG